MTKTKKVFSLLILLGLIFLVSGCFNLRSASDSNSNNNQSKAITPEPEIQYEPALKEILQPYWQDQGITELKTKILALKAPAEYLDLHLNLVIAFELIEQGQRDADQAKIEEGIEKLEQLKIQYPWLE
jgi:hypothetical protein